MKHLKQVVADKGSICINGICFATGQGDGVYSVSYSDTLPDGYQYIASDIFIDLRDKLPEIWANDCTPQSAETFDLPALAVRIAQNADGDMCLVKYF